MFLCRNVRIRNKRITTLWDFVRGIVKKTVNFWDGLCKIAYMSVATKIDKIRHRSVEISNISVKFTIKFRQFCPQRVFLFVNLMSMNL